MIMIVSAIYQNNVLQCMNASANFNVMIVPGELIRTLEFPSQQGFVFLLRH